MSRVIAFDIDGVLTEREGIEIYRNLQEGDDTVGIVSARSRDNTIEFMVENDLSSDFMRSSPFKGSELAKIRKEFSADEYIYYGSWLRDRIHASIARWEYKQI